MVIARRRGTYQLIKAPCDLIDAVGDAVHITASGAFARVDITDPTTLPCVGVIVAKTDTTHAIVQVSGQVVGIYSGLTPGQSYFVDASARPTTVQPIPTTAGIPLLGYAITPTVLFLKPSTIQTGLPNQTGLGGEFLTTDGTLSAWAPLTYDVIAPGFTITSFALTVATLVEVGTAVVNPGFTASYNRPAAAVTLNDGSGAVTLTLPATAFSYGTAPLPARTYTLTGINSSQLFTLAAHEAGGPTKTTSASITWAPRVYYGPSAPGTNNASFITSLATNGLATGRQRTISMTVGAGQAFYYAVPTVFGGAPSNFVDTGTGFAVGVSLVATTSVTNANGVVIPYNIFRSNQLALGQITVAVG